MGGGGGGGGKWAGGPLCLWSPLTLACQTHSCLTKSFLAVKFQRKDVTAEDSVRSTMLCFYCRQLAGVFPPSPVCFLLLGLSISLPLSLPLSMQCEI